MSNNLCRSIRIATMVLTLVVGSGCGGSGLYPVRGRVVWSDDSAATDLAGGTVLFDAPERKISSQGIIAEDATFTLMTHNPNDGAPPGDYGVAVAPPASNDEGGRPSPLDPKYLTPDTSEIRLTLEPRANDVTIRVTRSSSPMP
jgi:hypothetical protein